MDADPFDLIGDVIDGQFRVDAFAGEGDLSAVYKGHHLGVDAPVAIKFLNLPSTLDPALARPLVDGFKEASRIHYKLARGNLNIAQSIASGTTLLPRTGANVPYLVREWFEGKSLASDLASRRDEKRSGRSIQEALSLLETAFDGVGYAHEQGDVHLSINPSNLFLAQRGNAVALKVLDFGIARTMNDLMTEVPPASRPEGGLRVLFPAYAAPEQLDQSIGKPGPWTDVYALALVTMEVLSDRLVMAEQETGAIVGRALDANRRPSPRAHGLKLPRNLDLVLTRAVARAPARRQESAAALRRDIKSALRGTASGPMPAAGPSSAQANSEGPPEILEPPPLPVAEAPPKGAMLRPQTLIGMGIAPLDVGSPGKASTLPATSVETLPMAFEAPSSPSEVHSEGQPPPTPVPTLQPPESASAVEPPAFPTPPFLSMFKLFPVQWHQRSARLLIAVGTVVGAAVLVALIVSLRRPSPSRERMAAATAMSTGSAAPAPPPTAPEPAAPEPAAAPTPARPFNAFVARQRLDATSRSVLACRKGKRWGVAIATVTFANDGSVSGVAVGVPFTGTHTGACVATELSAAHAPPFAGKPGTLLYQFFVAPK